MTTITGEVAEAVLLSEALAEVVSEAEAASVGAASGEEWAEAVVLALASKINAIQCPSFEIN